MSAILQPAAQRANADVAGLTHVVTGPHPGAPQAASPHEVITAVSSAATGALDSIMAGGAHPEHIIPQPVATDLTRATDSLAGKMGGLVPRFTGTVAPGPSGAAASARSTWDKLKTRLGL